MSVPTSNNKVNLLDLCAAAIACTVTASKCIQEIAPAKNTRTKADGSFVTDADFVAQGVIVQALQSICPTLNIVGEESPEEMKQHEQRDRQLDRTLWKLSRNELQCRYFGTGMTHLPLHSKCREGELPAFPDDPEEFLVDPLRLRVIVDPLDGTKSYTNGDHDAVSILIGFILDDAPVFGVVGKPFGYTGLSAIRDTGCVTLYGGTLLRGAFVAGDKIPLSQPNPITPKAVISASRSKGVVQQFCQYLGEKGLLAADPLLVPGAGEKSVRILLSRNDEALWFYPKPGTSLWDVAATDALLRALGGKLTDKYGHNMDYSKSREEAENVDGVVACMSADLHRQCIELFAKDNWNEIP
jgi:3'(2'), 5'-bisphosphate nucleotidase